MQIIRRTSIALFTLALVCLASSTATAHGTAQEAYPSAIYAFPFSMPGSVEVEVVEVSQKIPGFEGETTVHILFTVHNSTEKRVELDRSEISVDWVEDEDLPELGNRPDQIKGETKIDSNTSSKIHAFFDVDIGVGPEPDDVDLVRVNWELEIGTRLTLPDSTTFVAYRTGEDRAYYVTPYFDPITAHQRYHHLTRGMRIRGAPVRLSTGRHRKTPVAPRLRVMPK